MNTVALTMPTAGAGKWAWQGWANAFEFFGWRVVNLNSQSDVIALEPDLVICTTSQPRDDILNWRKLNPYKKLALNVLAWTDDDIPGIHNVGVQATPGNVEYAHALKPDAVFAQYSEYMNLSLLKKWGEEGFVLSSMPMAADAVVYPFPDMSIEPSRDPDLFYVGGRWAYKAQNLDRYVLPVIQKHESIVVGQGWPFPTTNMNEVQVGHALRNAKVVPNAHEPHSTQGGFDVVERVFKTMYCGGLCVSDIVDEIEVGFGLEEVIMASPELYGEAIDKVIAHNEDYDFLREDGQRRVALHHTYFNRVAMLLFDLGLINAYDHAVTLLAGWHKRMGLV